MLRPDGQNSASLFGRVEFEIGGRVVEATQGPLDALQGRHVADDADHAEGALVRSEASAHGEGDGLPGEGGTVAAFVFNAIGLAVERAVPYEAVSTNGLERAVLRVETVGALPLQLVRAVSEQSFKLRIDLCDAALAIGHHNGRSGAFEQGVTGEHEVGHGGTRVGNSGTGGKRETRGSCFLRFRRQRVGPRAWRRSRHRRAARDKGRRRPVARWLGVRHPPRPSRAPRSRSGAACLLPR